MNKITVQSSTGTKQLDNTGSPVGVTRIDPGKIYPGIPALLKDYIDNSSEKAWQEIRLRIDAIYGAVSSTLTPLETETGFSAEIRSQVRSGKKLLFKPNMVMLPSSICRRTAAPSSVTPPPGNSLLQLCAGAMISYMLPITR